jgi:glycosyltransferase involved in cell wall biosynthesis
VTNKTLIYCDTGWSLGQLYSAVAPHVGADFVDWSTLYPPEFFQKYDRVLTLAGSGSSILVDLYKVPRSKILVVAHADEDLIKMLRHDGDEGVRYYAGFGVVSDTLACVSLSLGMTRVPTVLRQGICCATYAALPASQLRTVGYAAVMSKSNAYGVEIKRGELVMKVVEGLGLKFEPAMTKGRLTRDQMSGYYKTVDAVVCSSLQEGGARPPYEAAAAGRLVVGTPVGDFPRLALEGMGVMGPLNDGPFAEFLGKTLGYYRSNRRCFQLKCKSIQAAARGRDWPAVVGDWVRFVKESS